MSDMNEKIIINGIEYVKADAIKEMARSCDGMDYCMVRTYSAGVFCGYIESHDGKEVVMREARRIWYWSGAASLSQLAMEGTKKPNECKFPCTVDTVILTDVIEIIPMTEVAKKSIEGVPVWTA